tara:strand:+ start:613 stop:789 length:177 start_codon:yes stop_codon:yes gene_type:complete
MSDDEWVPKTLWEKVFWESMRMRIESGFGWVEPEDVQRCADRADESVVRHAQAKESEE